MCAIIRPERVDDDRVSAFDEFRKLPSTVMCCHFQHWHSQVATGKDEVLAAVDIEGMR